MMLAWEMSAVDAWIEVWCSCFDGEKMEERGGSHPWRFYGGKKTR
jgi:hypothetical protein